ncbi:hypothetical protein D3C75_1288730 [compost metagenome]
MLNDPLLVDRPPIANPIKPGVVTRPCLLLELADNIQIGQCGNCVLGGTPGHASRLH